VTADVVAPVSSPLSLQTARLPRLAPVLVGVVSLALAALIALLLDWKWVAIPFVATVIALVAIGVWSGTVEGRRAAVNRVMTLLIWAAVVIALIPLIWVLAYTVYKGAPAIDWSFLAHDATKRLDPVTFKELPGAGVLHAIVGTVMVTLGAAIISIPLGLMTAIYLVEYGKGTRLARIVTILVDVMTGIPSIVAGLFAVALFTTFGGAAIRIGLMGSVALSLLMIPTVVRAGEEMMRLVPDDLREASYALGVSKWRTILKVVIPTAFGGIVTGIMLAISRVIGETAPLLVAVGALDTMNPNLFSGRMETLPVYIMDNYNRTADTLKYAWGAALLLIILVMVLNILGRIIGRIFAPSTTRSGR